MAAMVVALAGCSTAAAVRSAPSTTTTVSTAVTTDITEGITDLTEAETTTVADRPAATDSPDTAAVTKMTDAGQASDTTSARDQTNATDSTTSTDSTDFIDHPDSNSTASSALPTTNTIRAADGTVPEPMEDPTVTGAVSPSDQIPSSGVFNPNLPALTSAFYGLAGGNAAVSVTVWRDHVPVFAQAAGFGAGAQPVTPDTPMVLASVSKLITSLTVARLARVGAIQADAPVPWDLLNIAHDPAWNDVTVRELLGHSAGMPKAQNSWLNEPGSCAIPLTAAMANPPTAWRGQWLYSNGNYCALGLLIEAVTGVDRGTAARVLVFDPIGVTGPHLTTDGQFPSDGPYPEGVARLERLGGAGTWMAASDDLAAMLDSVTNDDLAQTSPTAIMIDQYGWGHTGSVDGAKACAWVMDQGRAIVIGIVAGNRPSTGGRVCDVLVPALASDLGIWADKPHRLPD